MAKSILQYDMLISCPGDAENAVNIINEVVHLFNQQFSDTLGIGIRTRYWQYSAFAESGGKPQDILNRQIVDTSDLAIAVFKTRFGSPTDKYGSGTEEEIERMLSEEKQVFIFFDESMVRPSDVDAEQYGKVQDFKRRYKDKGIYWTFTSLEEFKTLFYAQITRYFMTLDKEMRSEGKSFLLLKAINGDTVEDLARILHFDMGGLISSDLLKSRIIDKFKKINQMPIVTSASPYNAFMALEKSVEIEKDAIEIINAVASKWDIEMKEGFFDIGELRESTMFHNPLLGEKELKGTREEKEKYYAIVSLAHDIYTMVRHMQMEEYYGKLCGVKLLICNDGTVFDEDIDVELTIPGNRYIDIDSIPVPKEEIDRDEKWSFSDIFEIQSTKDYISYIDTCKGHDFGGLPNSYSGNIFCGRDYEEEYREALNDVYEYNVYKNGTDVILKVHFDYLKQHQTAAFPTWIFLENVSDDFVIKYRIISKRNENIIEREMEIKALAF